MVSVIVYFLAVVGSNVSLFCFVCGCLAMGSSVLFSSCFGCVVFDWICVSGCCYWIFCWSVDLFVGYDLCIWDTRCCWLFFDSSVRVLTLFEVFDSRLFCVVYFWGSRCEMISAMVGWDGSCGRFLWRLNWISSITNIIIGWLCFIISNNISRDSLIQS
jgi:hypothetical protein